MKSERGYAVTLLLCILPVLMASGLAMSMFLSFSGAHDEIQQDCYREQIKLQEDVKKALRKLLNLNPRSTRLKVQYLAARSRWAVAVASMNPPAAAAARAQMTYYHQQRTLLDFEQKALIQSTNTMLFSRISEIKMQLMKRATAHQSLMKSFMGFQMSPIQVKNTKLSVERESMDLAPNYRLTNNFVDDQALDFRWKITTRSQGEAHNFLSFRQQFPSGCSTTINPKEATWPTVTRLVKSVSKL